MAKIAFYATNLTERGTAIALYDYAIHVRDLLGHESVVLYDRSFHANHPQVIAKFAAVFELIACDSFADADRHAHAQRCDLMYVLKEGKRDGLVSAVMPTMVHSVFGANVWHVHGAAYAYVSEWLSDHCARGLVPYVPHIVSVADTDDSLRAELGLSQEALVFGCYGGRHSFDIGFVKERVIPQVLETASNIHFAFMNIAPFIDHPRVLFKEGTADRAEKTAFINSCDAMLHARQRGETFGLAIGEFSLRGKPVLTYARSKERAHFAVLGETAQTYRTAEDLFTLLTRFDRNAPSAQKTYERLYSPEPVMQRFAQHLITPALSSELGGARHRLGAHRWDPSLLARLKISKIIHRY